MTPPLDFQSIIMNLQSFWASRGCLIWQPYYTQVGAGTMNPATVLRVLGPEPWNVAYVEPSVRPDDGRYGENPNRFQLHYQMQVILKPDPGNPQELYLESLQSLGVDPRQHDIRFVEDNWESPALGAWGLGWEVWLDGQEITQFTYFQQAGGMPTNPVSVEITYGLDRIAMTLQRVNHYRDLRWSQHISYGDLRATEEFEHSRYYFEIADVERLRQMYRLYEDEANSALASGLVLPAHDYILKCSHTFNVLDTRGAIGVTERQELFKGMRELSRRVAEAYLAQRQNLEYPWLKEPPVLQKTVITSPAMQKATIPAPGVDQAAFLLEIGVEELPASDLDSALQQLTRQVPAVLDELRLTHGEIEVLGTPRRLVVHVKDLVSQQPGRTLEVKGPPADRAFDATGQVTKAGEGFARSRGVSVHDLQLREIDGGRYAVAVVHEPGRPTLAVLGEALPSLIAGLKFDKSMRWNSSNVSFSRPIRWFLALFGGEVAPFEYAGLCSGRHTRGLRFHTPEGAEIKTPPEYFQFLSGQGILLNPRQRREVIHDQVQQLILQAGGQSRLDDALLDEVIHLVEAPTALLGRFDESSLKLPDSVLVSVMKKHQRYFPVYHPDGKLLPCFIAVRNGDNQHLDVVTGGNEQVITARFADAEFFITKDLQHRLEDYLPRLGTLIFQFKLGSMLDKSRRIEKLVSSLASIFALDPQEEQTALRAALLCKADLVTHMVVEMTSLQGIMGQFYALQSGEQADVAAAIAEHYLPRFSGDSVPQGRPGLVVGLADRLDSLAGLFAVGMAPSGTKDPFALRRAALGLVQSLSAWKLDFDLRSVLQLAAGNLPVPASPAALSECLEFITGRLRSTLLEQGFRYDVVEAILAAQSHNPSGASAEVARLSKWVLHPDWKTILPAFSRCVRITRDQPDIYPLDPARFTQPVEHELHRLVEAATHFPRKSGSVDGFLNSFLPLIPVINRYFEEVLVMDEDPALRANRLGQLQRIAALSSGVADLSKLEGF